MSVTPVGNDEYLVRTERVAPGVPLAEEQFVWPLESWLAQARQLMNDPLTGILQGDYPAGGAAQRTLGANPSNSSVMQPSLSLVELGQQLYHHLFQGTLRDSWLMAQGVAQNRRQALRLRLGLKGDRLPRLPWEVLYGSDMPIERMRQNPMAARPLATGIQVIFSRYRPATRLVDEGGSLTTEPGQPLKILMVIASPSDREQLQLYREATQLQQELRIPPSTPSESEIQLTILSQPGREELTQALEQGQFQVLHYAGHSDVSAGGGSLYLVNTRTGLTELMSGEDLAGLLVNNGIRLAVFNSCRGAYTPTEVDFTASQNLAEALVSRGIPAVLAMAEQIPDEVALNLTRLFYRNLKQGYPIDLSLSRARQGLITSYGSDQLYWALPILYLHPEFDGYLTPTDRSREDPADRLLFTPPTYEVFPLPTGEEAIFPPALLLDSESVATPFPEELIEADEAEMIAQAVLAEDVDWLDALEDAGAAEDDDFAVAEMIRQLIPPTPSETPMVPPAVMTPAAATDAAGSVPISSAGTVSPAKASERFASRELETSESGHLAAVAAQQKRVAPAAADLETAEPPSKTSPRTEEQTPTEQSYDRRTAARQRQNRAIFMPILGAAGAIGIGLLAYCSVPRAVSWFQGEVARTTAPSSPGTPQTELAAKSPAELKQIATESFTQNRYNRGQQAVEALLDRGAFAEAEAALASIPADRRNDAATHFLQGRLAWQAAKQGNKKYTVADARQSWQKAIAVNPTNPLYYQAIGFADYEAGNPDEAIQSWVRALSLQEQPAAQQASTAAQPNLNDRVLTSYAGIALALWKTSTNPNTTQPGEFLSKAVKTYQMVETMNPETFKPDALSQNWLWTPAAVRDWQTLGAATPEANGG